MRNKSTIWSVLLAMCLLMGTLHVNAKNYYVATTGSYGASGTISNPVDKVTTIIHDDYVGVGYSLSPGDTIFVGPGTYNDKIHTGSYTLTPTYDRCQGVTIIAQDMSNRPVFLPNDDGNSVFKLVGICTGLKIIGLIVDGSNIDEMGIEFYGTDVHDNFIIDCEVRNCNNQGIYISGTSHDNTIQGCNIHDNTSPYGDYGVHGIYAVGQGTLIKDCFIHHQPNGNGIRTGTDDNLRQGNEIIIRNNTLCFNLYPGNIDRAGIYVSSTTGGVEVYNNVCHNNGNGIIVGGHADGVKVYHNTLYNNLGYGIKVTTVTISGTPRPNLYTELKNNLLYKNGDPLNGTFNGFFVTNDSCASTLDSSDNVWNVYDPEFIDRGAANFHLASTSDAIGICPVLTSVPVDKDSLLRSGMTTTAGAYEGGSGSYTYRGKFYVSTTGNDMDAGTSGAPYQRIIRGMQELFPGDTLVVMGNDSFFFDYEYLVPYGEPGNEVVIMANPGDKPVFRRATPSFVLSRPVIFGMDIRFRYKMGNNEPHDMVVDGIIFDAKDYTSGNIGTCFSVGEKRNTFKNCIFQNFTRNNIIDAGGVHTQVINSLFEPVTILTGSGAQPYDSCTVYIAADSCTFLRDTMKGNSTGHHVFVRGNYNYFDSCQFKSAARAGLYLDGSVNTSQGHHNIFTNGSLRSNGQTGGNPGLFIRGSNNKILNSVMYANYHGIRIYSSNHQNFPADTNVVKNCQVDANSVHGIYMDFTLKDTISQNSIGYNAGHGIIASNGAYHLIEKNDITVNAYDGIRINAGSIGWGLSKVINNIIDYNDQCGINMQAVLVDVYNNSIASNVDTGIYIRTGSSNIQVKNNLVYNNSLDIHSDVGYTASNNWLTGAGNPDVISISQPADYHLLSSSGLKDFGTTLAAVADDFEGNARPGGSAYDIGAFEYTSARPAGNDDNNGLAVIHTETRADRIRDDNNGLAVIHTKTGADRIRIYPIPFGNQLMIEAKGNLSYELYNQVGSLVSQGSTESGKVIIQAEESWSNGLYLLRIVGKDDIKTYKVQLQR